ncbi:MAG TPA: NmrA/HSCARG family protein [Thermoplasmata archaeon]|nr:NmrA/HSCARG family protein [Thermoplasmata archaeon]
MAETKTILVAGVTGQQGGSVAKSLLKRGHRVVGLTRNPSNFPDLEAKGIRAVQGDLTDAASLAAALRGVDGFFLMTTPFGPYFSVDTEMEIRQGTTGIDAARAARTPHLILASVGSADEGTGIPHFESKAKVEQYLKGTDLRYTITRPVAFMDSLMSPWMADAIRSGILARPMPPTTRQQLVAVKDIGEIVARAFDRPDKASGKTVDLAGDEVTVEEQARKLGERLGHPIRYVEIPDGQAMQQMGEDPIRMFRWFRTVGYHVDIPALETEWGYRMTRFDEYLSAATWEG